MTTFNWDIIGMSCYPEAEGKTDVVFQVNYSCSTLDTANGVPYLALINAQVPVTYTADSVYTPFAQLTSAQVIEWVKSALGEDGVKKMETDVLEQLQKAQNPTVVTPPLPWQVLATPPSPDLSTPTA